MPHPVPVWIGYSHPKGSHIFFFFFCRHSGEGHVKDAAYASMHTTINQEANKTQTLGSGLFFYASEKWNICRPIFTLHVRPLALKKVLAVR